SGVQEATKAVWHQTPSAANIWHSIQSRDILKNIRNFLWKCLHNKYKIGPYWRDIPDYERRGTCALCGEEESMILDCTESPSIKTIWDLTRELWCKREPSWPV